MVMWAIHFDNIVRNKGLWEGLSSPPLALRITGCQYSRRGFLGANCKFGYGKFYTVWHLNIYITSVFFLGKTCLSALFFLINRFVLTNLNWCSSCATRMRYSYKENITVYLITYNVSVLYNTPTDNVSCHFKVSVYPKIDNFAKF